MRRIGKVIKRLLLAFLLIAGVLAFAYRDLLSYGIMQARGQLHIVWNARPVEDYLAMPSFPDSLKQKLRLIDEVRQFAIDSLSLRDTKNYRTLYDQQGQEIMWVVMASEPFRLRAKEWHFPIIGSVPYKGFFNRDKARELTAALEAEGWDVNVRNPGGWSTLGWFTDPILSKMLHRSEGDLANLIIHEMSHSTIFVKDSIDFNENLASFIADRGAEQFLLARYGPSSREYRSYIEEGHDYNKFVDHMLRGASRLDSLYEAIEHLPAASKAHRKEVAIRAIVQSLDTLSLHADSPRPSLRFSEKLPNNAYFMNYMRYQARQDVFMKEYQERFGGDLRAYIEYLTARYPFL